MLTRVVFLAGFLACLVLGLRGAAAEQLIFEDFEKLNLQQLPAGWTLTSAGDFSIVDEPGHGKVLKISHKGGGWPSLSVQLDSAKVNGHEVRISALAKFPGAYPPVADKAWARPKIMLSFKDKDGKEHYAGFDLEPNKPDWQSVSAHTPIDKDAQAVTAHLRIDLAAAEIFFDDFCVELDPDLNSPPPKAKAAGAVAGAPAAGTPAAGTPAAVAPVAGAGTPAEKAPRKTLDVGGALFGPEIAAAMQKAVKPGGSYTYAVVGPGLPMKEFDATAPEKWTRLPSSKELCGPAASPRNLLAALPLSVVAQKPEQRPEVVFVVGETTTTRKTSMYESLDWEDLARLCLRLGAVPVLAIPSAAPSKDGPITMQEDQRAVMLKAATEVNCPVMDLGVKDPAQVTRVAKQLITLLDKHVFWRTPLDQAGGVQTPRKKTEEE